MKNILLIAGSDSIGGAGVQADIKTCEALGCYSANAITCAVAENTAEVADIVPMPISFIKSQIECILKELRVDAVKIGMLFSAEIIQALAPILKQINAPIVLDPVCISKGGSPLIESSAISALRELLPLATISTPNRFEFKELLDGVLDFPCDVLVKKNTSEGATDVLYKKSGQKLEFVCELLEPNLIHGTGCTLSTAIACFLARGLSVEESIKSAKNYVSKAISGALSTKFGVRILNHKVNL
ncbi:hydroxymethylpyrimidine/phosphomethylpyrimidine kinase [Campylobacter sp. 19-13652]|uniref:bifunctional hydroxymethylpyrimidine kinase/phosphomethylpyrimidine kinase n=1 Tax=Campylobacter sp. 19-13652 TaxID=2840180 RepID=UPI001C763C4E|nr:hydroxymethylpyrimidine/phosphomethylpyrimidine kinase [Campylobacter sp. 19-13652]BCX79801.1 hydroxymethylpyrimidine/phosphomethylpyrimidine kinase [Campylobacter sp. 19-13652]